VVVWFLDDALTGTLPMYGPYSGNAYYFRNNYELTVDLVDLKYFKEQLVNKIKVLNEDYRRLTGPKTGSVAGVTRTYVFEGKTVNVLTEDVDTVIAFLES